MVVERLAKKHIIYAGVENPISASEIKVEILGLKNAVKQAEEMISRYEQVFAISMLKNEERQQDASQTESNPETQKST